MSIFNDILKEEESLFIDDSALETDYNPPKIEFRENETGIIVDSIKPLFRNRSGKNLFIVGGPGIGKTVAVKKVLEELKTETSEIVPLYVNCWKKDTGHKIILDICDQLDYRFTMQKTTEQLVSEVSKILNKKSAVIVLDEIDKLSVEATTILYSLLEDIYRKVIILVTNNRNFLVSLDRRILSRLVPEELEFRPYTFDETHAILSSRVKYAFVPGIFPESGLRSISERTFGFKDIRRGLFLLKEAGNIAERKLKRVVSEEDVSEALSKVKDFQLQKLSDEQKKILDLVKKNDGNTTKKLHELFDINVSYRTFMRKLSELDGLNLINIENRNEAEGRKSYVRYCDVKTLGEI